VLPGPAAGWESIESRVSDDLDCDSAATGHAGKCDGAEAPVSDGGPQDISLRWCLLNETVGVGW
jgi:hypothetical protein